MTGKPTKELWCDYLFLTKEMAKFISRSDMDMIAVLIEQRERLQQIIDDLGDVEFRKSAEGKKIMTQVRDENALVSRQMQMLLNKGKQQHALERTYSPMPQNAGGHLNRQG